MHGWQALPLFALFAACLGVRQGRLAAPVAPKSALRPRAHPTLSSAAPPPPPPDDAAPSESGNELSGQLSDELRRREQTAEEPGLDAFNSGLYAHLRRRPEFADRELYNELSNRVDVSENVFNSWREQVNATTRLEPRAGQTPGEVIELVLRALQDCDYPHEGHGIDVLQRFSSEACIASPNKISSEQLSRYVQDSKFRVMLEWVNVLYSKKLETSIEGKRAYQELRLKSGASGDWTVVNFVLGSTEDGVWLIDHIRVRGAAENGYSGYTEPPDDPSAE